MAWGGAQAGGVCVRRAAALLCPVACLAMCLVMCLLAGVACDAAGSPAPPAPEPPEAELNLARTLASAQVRAVPAAPSGSALSASALLQVPEPDTRRFKLRPPILPLQHLALTAERLAQLTDGGLNLYPLRRLDKPLRAEAEGGRRVVPLIGGSLLVLAKQAMLRWSPRDEKPQRFARVPLLGPTFLIPDRREVTRFSVMYGHGNKLYDYDLNAPGMTQLELMGQRELPNFDGGAIGFTKNAAIRYSVNSGGSASRLVELRGDRTTSWRLPDEMPEVRGIQAHRMLNRAWLLSAQGLALVELHREVHVLWRQELGFTPYSWNSVGRLLAVVGVTQAESSEKQWLLRVYDDRAQVRFEAKLPTEGDPGRDDWLERLIANREVVLGESTPIVAVGGSSALWVYDWRAKKLKLSVPATGPDQP